MKKLRSAFQAFQNFIISIRKKLPKLPPMKPETRAKWEKVIAFMNRFSILFHALLSCFLVFIIEVISRRSLSSAITFIGGHTLAYLYNSLIIFVSLSAEKIYQRQ